MGDRLDHARVEERLADNRRLAALADTELLDGPADEQLDRWARRAGVALDAPVALVSLVDADRAFYAASSGVTWWPAELRGTPLSHAPCQHVVSASAPLIVSDARAHPALHDSAAVTELGVVAFAGVPLLVDGETIGALCVIDHRPRAWTEGQQRALHELAADVSIELELRSARVALARGRALVSSLNRVHALIADDAPLHEILDKLVRCFEATDPALVGSVLLLEGDALRHGAAPTLPPDYMAAIDGVAIGPAVGTCGAAAWWGHEVVTEDIARDPAWAPYRPLAAAYGLAHCWSVPIKARDGAVLGTFALYGGQPRVPRDEHLSLMRDASHLAGIAVERARAFDELRHQATHDDLTGLPNRRLVNDRLVQALARAQRSGAAVTVAFVDIDRLKLINDVLGHAAGDELMRAAAAELSGATRPGDTLGRFGGDEFVAIAEALPPDAVSGFGERLRAAVEAVGARMGTPVTASVGVAVVDPASEPDEVLCRADGAMYAAKRAGGDRVVAFEEALRPQVARRLRLAGELRGAIARAELRLVFQPIYALGDGRLAGVEALLRWDSAALGAVSPGEFIPVAEETGQMPALGAWVLREACLVFGEQVSPLGGAIALGVNVSARQLEDAGLPATVRDITRATGFDPHRLVLEITETALLRPAPQITAAVAELRELGARLVLDDFGTGYSSLTSLKEHPINALKIDRSFVNGLPDDPEDRAIVRAVLAMAGALGRTVTAEGVETLAQLDALRALGCDYAQGFLLSRPVEGAALGAVPRTVQEALSAPSMPAPARPAGG